MRLINVAAFCPLLFAAIPAVVQGQSERRSLSGDHVALYNVAGTVRVERARGRDVEVEITRAGRDAGKLRIESGTVRGLPTLRGRNVFIQNQFRYCRQYLNCAKGL